MFDVHIMVGGYFYLYRKILNDNKSSIKIWMFSQLSLVGTGLRGLE